MNIDCVFSGGGIKAYAFLGSLKSINDKKYRIQRVAGTSAGAIIAALIAAKYTIKEIENMLDQLDIEKLLDPPLISKYIPMTRWALLYRNKGLYKGNKLEEWLEEKLALKGIETFAHIKENDLKIVVSDISLGKLIVIPDDLDRVYGVAPEQFKVATAVRMSASFPYFFMPKKLYYSKTYSYIVDGGLLSNFPLWVFNENKLKRPILGLNLSDNVENIQPKKINDAVDMFRALFLAMMRAHDARYISKTKQHHIVFIPVKEVKTLEFSLSNTEKEELIDLGKVATENFLKTWPK